MKKDIHPEWYPEAKVICNGEVVMTIGSTQPELRVDVWSGNHPFYTGEQRIVDTAGQVERFMNRLKQFDAHQEVQEKRQQAAQEKTKKSFLNQQLIALDLSDRVFQLLLDNNYVTVGDIITQLEKDEQVFLELEGFGPKSLEHVKEKVEAARQNLDRL